jgi:hypothetical protein
MLGNYRVSKQLGISRVVLSSIELVSYVIPARLTIPERAEHFCIWFANNS